MRLTGSNLGIWLVQEIWMIPLAERTAPQGDDKPTKRIDDHVSLWRVLEKRLWHHWQISEPGPLMNPRALLSSYLPAGWALPPRTSPPT